MTRSRMSQTCSLSTRCREALFDALGKSGLWGELEVESSVTCPLERSRRVDVGAGSSGRPCSGNGGCNTWLVGQAWKRMSGESLGREGGGLRTEPG